jgi:prophage regulatory protein
MSSLLRYPAVSERIGLSRSAIYARVRDGRFPQPIPVGPRVVAWPEAEVAAWLDATIHGATEDELRELVKTFHADRGCSKPNPERQAIYDNLTSTRMERRKERKERAYKEDGQEGIALCAEAVSSQGGRTREYLIRRVLCADLPAHLKLVVISIANAANDKGFALIMRNRIAAQLGQSDEQVMNDTRELQDRGILLVAQYGYQINLDALPHPRRNQA